MKIVMPYAGPGPAKARILEITHALQRLNWAAPKSEWQWMNCEAIADVLGLPNNAGTYTLIGIEYRRYPAGETWRTERARLMLVPPLLR